jgi:hypothetical protein
LVFSGGESIVIIHHLKHFQVNSILLIQVANNWLEAPGKIMVAAKGYIIQGPSFSIASRAVYEAGFKVFLIMVKRQLLLGLYQTLI